MSLTRRSFIKAGALGALTAGLLLKSGALSLGQSLKRVSPKLDFPVPYEAKKAPTFYYTRSTFEPYIGSIFRSRARGRYVNLTLLSVSDCTPSAKSQKVTTKARTSDCFSLTFRASASLTELTTIQQIEHDALGNFDLFLTRRDEGKIIYYEAVFNHAQ